MKDFNKEEIELFEKITDLAYLIEICPILFAEQMMTSGAISRDKFNDFEGWYDNERL